MSDIIIKAFIVLAVFSPLITIGIVEFRSHTGRINLKCYKCGVCSRPINDKRWRIVGRGSTSETYHECWEHNCEYK